MKYNYPIYLIFLFASCSIASDHQTTPFSKDLDFLKKHDSVVVLKAGQSQVIVSPKYQGKVFTSTGDGKQSFGWINYKAFDAVPDRHMNAYGGENRLWLGPEGNRFSLFFEKAKPQVFDNWVTPAAFDHEAWDMISAATNTVHLAKNMKLVNYAGTVLQLHLLRKISILDRLTIGHLLNNSIEDITAVGYETKNTITNTGPVAWDSASGAPCLWILDMFPPSDQTTIVIPYRGPDSAITSDYFGPVPPRRLRKANGVLYFKADGKQRGKLGISPAAAAPGIAASFDAGHDILTLVFFDVTSAAPYLNQQWNSNQPPYRGDAVNAYNDGPLAGGGQLGPFYELESVSPAAFLQPGGSLVHRHTVVHLSGKSSGLDKIARALLGVDLGSIRGAFDAN